MSSLGAVFNSLSTILTMDIYKLYRPHASDEDLVWFGRMACAAMVVVGVVWIPVLEYGTQHFPIFVIIQTISSTFGSTLAAVFILGMLVPRVNHQGALSGLIFGIIVGGLRLVFVFVAQSTCSASPDQLAGPPTMCWDFFHFSGALFGLVVVITYGVSLLYPPPDETQVGRVMLFGEDSAEENADLLDKDQNPITEDETVTKVEDSSSASGPFSGTFSAGLPSEPKPPGEDFFTNEITGGTSVNDDPVPPAGSGEGSDGNEDVVCTPRDNGVDLNAEDGCGPSMLVVHRVLAVSMLTVEWFLVIGFACGMYGLLWA